MDHRGRRPLAAASARCLYVCKRLTDAPECGAGLPGPRAQARAGSASPAWPCALSLKLAGSGSALAEDGSDDIGSCPISGPVQVRAPAPVPLVRCSRASPPSSARLSSLPSSQLVLSSVQPSSPSCLGDGLARLLRRTRLLLGRAALGGCALCFRHRTLFPFTLLLCHGQSSPRGRTAPRCESSPEKVRCHLR